MARTAVAFFLFCCLMAALSAQATASPSTFTWENYKGSSQWSVSITDDETACGNDAPFHETESVTITHNLAHASTNDLPHGPWSGTFSGNTLSVPGRGVPDSGGTTVVPTTNIVFTPDCMGFSGRYRWSWSDSEQSCSGTTSFSARRVGASGCPGPAPVPSTVTPPVPTPTPEQIRVELNTANTDLQKVRDLYKEARSFSDSVGNPDDEYGQMKYNQAKDKMDALEPALEQKYRDILKADPNNFWANWDLAQLRKTQGDNQGYYDGLGKAVDGDPTFYESTRETMKAQALSNLGWDRAPDARTSSVVGKLKGEVTGWSSGSISDIMVTRPPQDTRGFMAKVLDTFSKTWSDGLFGVGGFKTTPSQ